MTLALGPAHDDSGDNALGAADDKKPGEEKMIDSAQANNTHPASATLSLSPLYNQNMMSSKSLSTHTPTQVMNSGQ